MPRERVRQYNFFLPVASPCAGGSHNPFGDLGGSPQAPSRRTDWRPPGTIFCRVTTCRRNFWALNGLRRRLCAVTARFLSLGMPGSGLAALAMSGLPTRRLPAVNLSLKLGVLAVALVPPAGLVLASTPLEETNPRARSSSSGRSAGLWRTLTGAHGRGHSQGKSSGRMLSHSLRSLSKLERNAYWPVYRFLENETGERNRHVDTLGTRRRSAAHQ